MLFQITRGENTVIIMRSKVVFILEHHHFEEIQKTVSFETTRITGLFLQRLI